MNRQKSSPSPNKKPGFRNRVETFCELCERTVSVSEGPGIAVCMDCHRAICSLEIGHD